jgi:uncharacterized membrane protein YuzA (DUF378 family)
MELLNNAIAYIVNPLIYLLVGLAVIYFLYGVFNFVRNAENSEKRAEGASHILWGIIGIAIMFSVFAFVRVIQNTIGPDASYPESLPL